jgi:hypothetical protein
MDQETNSKAFLNLDDAYIRFLDSPFIGLLVAAFLVEYAASRLSKRSFAKKNILPWYLLFFGVRFVLKGIL